VTTVRYDSGCPLCRGFASWVAERDSRGRLRLEPLAEASDTVVVVTDSGVVLERSRAVLRVLAELGGVWRMAALALGMVPPFISDAVYRWVARNRCRIACETRRAPR
jgi:predicted DCC family thiol-disulfide oxidoreductase YuxK